MTIQDDVTGDTFNLIDTEGAALLRQASMLAARVPEAKMQAIGLGPVVLQPGERAVLPVHWNTERGESFQCSTHPNAPAGITVLPGICPPNQEMSLCIENESPLPVTITEKDQIAVAMSQEEMPTYEECAQLQGRREKFHSLIDWQGGGEDVIREVTSPWEDHIILVVIHLSLIHI